MVDVKEINILNKKECRCNRHIFSLSDITGIEPLEDAHGFYGNMVKNCAIVICPVCQKETILLLKQAGQTWDIMNTAIKNEDNIQNEVVTSTGETIEELNGVNEENMSTKIIEKLTENIEIQNDEEEKQNNEFICPVCKKVCKNQLGLNAHMRTHQN